MIIHIVKKYLWYFFENGEHNIIDFEVTKTDKFLVTILFLTAKSNIESETRIRISIPRS